MAVGQALTRVEGRDKVTGGARYAAEAPVSDAAFGYVLQSRVGKGRIAKLDVSAAESSPGVIAILTPDNMPKLEGGFSGDTRAPLSDMNVLFAGQHLAVVVADTPERARYAASLILIDYDEAEPVVDMHDPRVQETNKTSDGEEVSHARKGDVEAALLEPSLTVVRATYVTPKETHNPLEMSATVAAWESDRLTVWDSTQGVTRTRDALAKAFNLDPANVRVFCPHTGGAFGCKGEQWHHKFLAAAAARLAGQPVRLVLTRQQMFTSCGHRPETEQEITLAASNDGKLVAMKHASTVESSPTNTHVESCGRGTTRELYATPNMEVTHVLRSVDLPPPTWMRAPGECPGSFALESAMDELADALGIDPLELRLINHADVHPESGKEWSTKHLRECYRIGAERFGWARRDPTPGSMRRDGKLIGWGMATAAYPAHKWASTARIRLRLDRSGQVRAEGAAASQDLGTGTWTIGKQIVAELMGLSLDRVLFEIGDSDLPKASLSGGSATAANLAISLAAAAKALKRALLKLAENTPLAGLRPNEVIFDGDSLRAKTDPGRCVQLGELLDGTSEGFLEGVTPSEPEPESEGDDVEEKDRYAFHSFGAHFIEVTIDDPVPLVRVRRVVSVMDIGRVVNPRTARSQVLGGVVMGLGMALMEETKHDHRTGRVVTDNLADYAVCTHADVPDIEVEFVDEPDYRFNPIGCRGVGEIGITGVAAAVANAVYHATGRRIRELPITPDRLL